MTEASGDSSGQVVSPPFLFLVLIPVVLAVVLAEFSEGGMDARALAVLGVLTAVNAVLRRIPGGRWFAKKISKKIREKLVGKKPEKAPHLGKPPPKSGGDDAPRALKRGHHVSSRPSGGDRFAGVRRRSSRR